MKTFVKVLVLTLLVISMIGCKHQNAGSTGNSPAEILGNPDYLAFSYGGYRHDTRENGPTVDELKEDMLILSAMGVRIIRTYNASQFPQAENILKAIRELKEADPSYEMYVMIGAWIDCEGAWTDTRNHELEDEENNSTEIAAAVQLANAYPDIVKVISVGNEAMVHWASQYFVQPGVILRWVNHLQELKKTGGLTADLWITSSDNFASWGGDDASYHNEDLTALMEAVDYISMHTYPFHDSHHNPAFWAVPVGEEALSEGERIETAMVRAKAHAISQYQSTADYMASLGIDKPIHIGETGWASTDALLFGATGSGAADEYKQELYYRHMREWTREAGMSCFYFEAFDETWKDQGDPKGSENHFGLINLKGEAKYALWAMVDEGVFKGLTRKGVPITKTFGGDESRLLAEVVPPPFNRDLGLMKTATVNDQRKPGEVVTEGNYVLVHESLVADGNNDISYPSAALKLNAWEGTCAIDMSTEGIIEVVTGTGGWWGCAMELESSESGENLSNFKEGSLHFEMKGNTSSIFNLGFQSGRFPRGDQVNNYVTFGPGQPYSVTEDWSTYSVAVSELDRGAVFSDVSSPLYFRGDMNMDGKHLYLKNIFFSKK